MRLDKYLKVSRLIKRRTLAKEVAEGSRVTINGRRAKPASEVKPGDELAINFGVRQLRVRVLEVRESARVSEAPGMYEVLSNLRRESDFRSPPAAALSASDDGGDDNEDGRA